jgi:hypothetical protein
MSLPFYESSLAKSFIPFRQNYIKREQQLFKEKTVWLRNCKTRFKVRNAKRVQNKDWTGSRPGIENFKLNSSHFCTVSEYKIFALEIVQTGSSEQE